MPLALSTGLAICCTRSFCTRTFAARELLLHEKSAAREVYCTRTFLHEKFCCTRCYLDSKQSLSLDPRKQTCSSWLREACRGLQEQQVLNAGPETQPRPRAKSLPKVKAFDKEQGISCKVLFSGVSLGKPFICQECSRAQVEGARACGRAEQVPGRTALDFRGPRLPWELAAPPRPTFLTHAFRRRARD